MQNSVLIFTDTVTNRLYYTCKLIFEQHLGLNYNFTTDKQIFTAQNGAKIWYGNEPALNAIHIASHSLLFEDHIAEQPIKTVVYKDDICPFATAGETFPFDMFAAIFYLVSRYEEYLPFEANQYGQFKASHCLAYKLGFLNRPVVDIWIKYLKDELANRNPFLHFKQKRFTATFTYDIDVAYAYRGRNMFVNTGRFLQECVTLNFAKAWERWQSVFHNRKDIFDTYADIEQQQQLYKHNLLYFFLLGPANKYNRNLPPNSKIMTELLKKISAVYPVGIHPSYFTNLDFNLLQQEKKLMESIIKKNITSSRQHYLRLSFPQTYNQLIEAKITDDYTLGFADLPGFRAGTCTPFPFYNLQKNKDETLMLYPSTFMEGTFIEDLKLPIDETQQQMKALILEVKKVNGTFISVWHNHTLCNKNEWKGMLEVHNHIAAYAAAND